MRYVTFGLLILILVVLSTGCFEEPVGEIVYEEYVPPTLPPLVVGGQGQSIFNTNCAGCHAMTGTGTLPGTPDFTDTAYWDSKSDEEIISTIREGREGTPMPPWKDTLSDAEIEDVVKYLKSFAGTIVSEEVVAGVEAKEEPVPVRAEVPAEYASFSENPFWHDLVGDYETARTEGQEIYVSMCQACHGASGLGEQETSIPGAASFADTARVAEISDAFWYWRIAEGIPGTAMPAWKDQLTEDEIWKVMVYEHSFSHDEPHVH